MRIVILLLSIAIALLASGQVPSVNAAEKIDNRFQDMLAAAGFDPETLAKISTDSDIDTEDWQLIAQLVYRLRQFSPAQLQRWATLPDAVPKYEKADKQLGHLMAIAAIVVSVERVALPEDLASETVLLQLYRCRFREIGRTDDGVVLVPRIPSAWQGRAITAEPVRFLGVALGSASSGEDQVSLLLTNHLAWYPRSDVSIGRLLLARQGMDVALLDEVKQRQPFVKPSVSREGEAFYRTLTALASVDRQELAELTLQSVATAAEQWLAKKPTFEQRRTELQQQLEKSKDSTKRDTLQGELKSASRNLALASAVEEQAQRQLSSVAPLYILPEEQVGELVRIEGVARRAVRIALPGGEAASESLGKTDLDAYYEMEVFTADSQNLPIVCCVNRLPEEFPVGDSIREPVRVDGVFFKSWRYRTRKNLAAPGETDRQQQMYTPVVVGGAPTWLATAETSPGYWGLWGGIAFLGFLVVFWITMFRRAERDRRQRAAARPDRLDDLSSET
jgi:hypothetical protein